jgi:hypothetical protein
MAQHDNSARLQGAVPPRYGEVHIRNRGRGCPRSLAVKCRDIVYILSPDILYTWCHPVKRRRALLESNLTEE